MYADPSGHAWYDVLWDWVNTIVGFINPISTLIALGSIAVAAVDGRWGDIVDDWNNGAVIFINSCGSISYILLVFCKIKGFSYDYYSMLWERTADWLGGVNRGDYKKASEWN